MANENEGERFAVDVRDFCETLIARQREFETEVRGKQKDFEVEVKGKLDAIDEVVKTALRDAVATLTAAIEKRMRPPGQTN